MFFQFFNSHTPSRATQRRQLSNFEALFFEENVGHIAEDEVRHRMHSGRSRPTCHDFTEGCHGF